MLLALIWNEMSDLRKHGVRYTLRRQKSMSFGFTFISPPCY